VHHRAAQAHRKVAHVVAVLRIPEPLVDDAVAADPPDRAVEDRDLAMIALGDDADVLQRPRVVDRDLAAGGLHLLPRRADLLAAHGVEHETHAQPLPRFARQCFGHAATELAVLPQVRLEVHASLRSRDVGDQRVVESAVLVDLHAVPADRHAERQSRDRRHEVLDRLARFELQVRVLVTLDRPNGDAEQGDGEEQRDIDPRHTGASPEYSSGT
jgi:hypothetical protein